MWQWVLSLVALAGCDRVFGLDDVPAAADAAIVGDWRQVAASDHFTCAITTANELYCWGNNANDQLGLDRTDTQVDAPGLIVGTWTSVATGNQHACAIKSDGSLWCWGGNFDQQIGTTSQAQSFAIPTLVDNAAPTSWESVAALGNHTCAITSDHQLWCWGNNRNRQIDATSNADLSPPTQIVVDGSPSWMGVTAGLTHTCAVTTDHVLYCWGANYAGQCGTDGLNVVPPTQVTGSFLAVAAGFDFTCALDTDHHVKCWGVNVAGQLGRATTGLPQKLPAQVASNKEYEALSAGWSTACAQTTTHTAECWGDLTGVSDAASMPTQIGFATWRELAPGRTHLCGIDTAGALSCAGDNTAGQLAQPAPDTTRPHAVAIHAGKLALGDHAACVTPTNTNNVASGSVSCWGDNASGELATGDFIRHLTPSPVLPGTLFATLTANGDHACGIDSSRNAFCWGDDPYGASGNGTTVDTDEPSPVLGNLAFSTIAAGGQHTCGNLMSGGTGYCWGRNLEGELADNTTTNQLVPTPMSLSMPPVTAFGVGDMFTCWVEGGTPNRVFCAGNNSDGELGMSTLGTIRKAVLLSPGTISLAAGHSHACALSAGQISCWGRGYDGELGNGMAASSSLPVMVNGTFSGVAAGAHHTCAITSTNGVMCWGDNARGQLGNGTRVRSAVPVPVVSLTGVTAIAAGGDVTCAVAATDTNGSNVQCWGDNGFGALGTALGWITAFTPIARP